MVGSALKNRPEKLNREDWVFRAIFDHSLDNIAVYDADARLVMANAALLQHLRVDLQDIVGKTPSEMGLPYDLSEFEQMIVRAAQQRVPLSVEVIRETEDDNTDERFISLIPVKGPRGTCTRVISYGRNSADHEKLRASMIEAKDQLHAAIRVLPDIFWIKDADGRYVLCNDEFNAFNGLEDGAALGLRNADLVQGEALKAHQETDDLAMAMAEPLCFKIQAEHKGEAEPRHYEIQKFAIRDSRGNVTSMLGMARDVTAQHRLEEQLKAREREFRQLAENLPDCLARFDIDGTPTYMNSVLRAVLKNKIGIDLDNIREEDETEAGQNQNLVQIFKAVQDVAKTNLPSSREYAFDCIDGDIIVHEIRLFPEYEADGSVASVLGIGRDITERKQTELILADKEKELEKLAYTDSLTGLENRATFHQRLEREVVAARDIGTKVALLTFDIDRFKAVNDSLGHAIGDELLCEFARMLTGIAGREAWIGRLGGDEFAVILPGLKDAAEAEKLAERFIKSVRTPMSLDGYSISVSTSIGITIAPDDTPCPVTLFRYSDIALFQAKAAGRGQSCRYLPGMNRRAMARFEMEAMINHGLKHGQFTTHFQPKINLATKQIEGAEALCRWFHDEKGFISPAEFIPVAEETGQILEIGRNVLHDAARMAAICNKNADTPFVVAVNVSARQFLYGDFLATLAYCLEDTGCKAAWLELEITESLLLEDDARISMTLETIARLGILISIDDFGTGYSALGYLHKFPIGGLKIDQSFIRQVDENEKHEVLIDAILKMARGLNLKTVAEGIETEKNANLLARLGCDQGQGYFWHKPMPAEDMLKLLPGNVSRDVPQRRSA